MKKLLAFFLLGLVIIAIPTYFYLHRAVKIDTEPLILGHGGMGVRSMYPLNSSGSINKALTYQVDGTEIDVKVSMDGELIAFHDSDLEKSTNCTGSIAFTNSTDVTNCEYNALVQSETVKTLKAILYSNHPNGTIFSIDLKPDQQFKGDFIIDFPTEVAEIVNLFPQYEFLIESQNQELLLRLQSIGIRADLYFYGHDFNTAMQIADMHRFDGVSINMQLITKAEIEQAQSIDLKVMLWGCGSVFSNRKALEMEPDIIQTDAIPSMMRILERH